MLLSVGLMGRINEEGASTEGKEGAPSLPIVLLSTHSCNNEKVLSIGERESANYLAQYEIQAAAER